MLERAPRLRQGRSVVNRMAPASGFPEEDEEIDPGSAPIPSPEPAYAYASPLKSRVRGGWVWLPLSFVFLLLGVVLGFQAALTMSPKAAKGESEFSLGLTVTREGSNLSVRWDRDAPAIRGAQKGVLEIEDGGFTKPVELDTAQLRNGSILFTNSTGAVRFRLTVYPQTRVSVIQTMEWKESR